MTDAEREILRHRQAHCTHAFIRGMADKEAHCVHCGLPESQYQAPPALSYTWTGTNLVPTPP